MTNYYNFVNPENLFALRADRFAKVRFRCYDALIMEAKRDLTRELLAECFKSLLLTTPFEKITIKMITDEAGLIRPTFYKHFQDKYEVMEWIFTSEVTDSVDLLIRNGMSDEAFVMLCRLLDKDRKFYRRACAVEGTNSFPDLLTRYIHKTLVAVMDQYPPDAKEVSPLLTNEVLASYYTHGTVRLICDWLTNELAFSAEELAASMKYLLSHSFQELVKADTYKTQKNSPLRSRA